MCGTYIYMCDIYLPGKRSPSPKRKEITQRPWFVRMPRDVTVNEGQDATFTCKVGGKPEPTIKW